MLFLDGPLKLSVLQQLLLQGMNFSPQLTVFLVESSAVPLVFYLGYPVLEWGDLVLLGLEVLDLGLEVLDLGLEVLDVEVGFLQLLQVAILSFSLLRNRKGLNFFDFFLEVVVGVVEPLYLSLIEVLDALVLLHCPFKFFVVGDELVVLLYHLLYFNQQGRDLVVKFQDLFLELPAGRPAPVRPRLLHFPVQSLEVLVLLEESVPEPVLLVLAGRQVLLQSAELLLPAGQQLAGLSVLFHELLLPNLVLPAVFVEGCGDAHHLVLQLLHSLSQNRSTQAVRRTLLFPRIR